MSQRVKPLKRRKQAEITGLRRDVRHKYLLLQRTFRRIIKYLSLVEHYGTMVVGYTFKMTREKGRVIELKLYYHPDRSLSLNEEPVLHIFWVVYRAFGITLSSYHIGKFDSQSNWLENFFSAPQIDDVLKRPLPSRFSLGASIDHTRSLLARLHQGALPN